MATPLIFQGNNKSSSSGNGNSDNQPLIFQGNNNSQSQANKPLLFGGTSSPTSQLQPTQQPQSQPKSLWQDLSSFWSSSLQKTESFLKPVSSFIDNQLSNPNSIPSKVIGSKYIGLEQAPDQKGNIYYDQNGKGYKDNAQIIDAQKSNPKLTFSPASVNPEDNQSTARNTIKNVIETMDPSIFTNIGKSATPQLTDKILNAEKLSKTEQAANILKSGAGGVGFGAATQIGSGASITQAIESAPANFLFGSAFSEVGKPTPLEEAKGSVKVFDFIKSIKQDEHPIDLTMSDAVVKRYGLPEDLAISPTSAMDRVFQSDPVLLHDFLRTTDTSVKDWNKAWALDNNIPIKTAAIGTLVDKPYWDKIKTQFEPSVKVNVDEKLNSYSQPVEPVKAPTLSEKPNETNNPLTPIGEGQVRTSGLSKGVEEKAVEQKLTNSLGDLKEYQQVSMKDQAKKATELVTNNEQDAIDIALGKKASPSDVLPESVFTAVENKALNDGNIDLIKQLANSTRVSEATAMGQRIRALAERNPDSAVGAIKTIQDAREKAVESKTGKTVNAAIKDVSSEIKSNVKTVSKESWRGFIDSIKC